MRGVLPRGRAARQHRGTSPRVVLVRRDDRVDHPPVPALRSDPFVWARRLSADGSMRSYRVVKMTHGDRMPVWAVVSVSLRDDDTWDVIQTFHTADDAWEYVIEVTERTRTLARCS